MVDRPRVEVTQEVLQFLTDYIDTVPQLEALLLLWENPHTTWTESEIAARIYVRPETAAEILRTLVRRGFVKAQEGGGYRYESQWDKRDTMATVANAYRQNLIPVSTFIHSKASSSVREFARAFEFKRDR
ncbi:MAG TPA: MarR family transcriptional regulator [Steroidobacteraceae bacterium]|nr:MarR family transcriptional regulator [Steroidobacteraceae bacterium]